MKQELATAIAIASEKHMGQFDKGGMPYILHPLKVMHKCSKYGMQVMVAAVLHDVVEDTNTTYEELRERGISERTIQIVKLLTKLPGQSLREYVDGILSDIDAIRVKLEDLTHNSDIRRLKGITEKDFARLKKYNEMYLELKQELTRLEQSV